MGERERVVRILVCGKDRAITEHRWVLDLKLEELIFAFQFFLILIKLYKGRQKGEKGKWGSILLVINGEFPNRSFKTSKHVVWDSITPMPYGFHITLENSF